VSLRQPTLLITVVLAGALGYVLLGGGSDPERASGEDHRGTSGPRPVLSPPRLIAQLPQVGRLAWQCDENGAFSTSLSLPDPGATVFVSVTADGRPVFERRRVDPGPGVDLRTPLQHVPRQRWRIRYHHKPATIRARVRIRFAQSRIGDCVAARLSLT